jgi:hypothetical protein
MSRESRIQENVRKRIEANRLKKESYIMANVQETNADTNADAVDQSAPGRPGPSGASWLAKDKSAENRAVTSQVTVGPIKQVGHKVIEGSGGAGSDSRAQARGPVDPAKGNTNDPRTQMSEATIRSSKLDSPPVFASEDGNGK